MKFASIGKHDTQQKSSIFIHTVSYAASIALHGEYQEGHLYYDARGELPEQQSHEDLSRIPRVRFFLAASTTSYCALLPYQVGMILWAFATRQNHVLRLSGHATPVECDNSEKQP